jgi:hypothetical protein
MEIHKFNKYTEKLKLRQKGIYLNKILDYYFKMSHNKGNSQYGGLKLNNFDSLLDFLKESYAKAPTTTTKKYFVILYGPPASGKTIARKIACHKIKELFGENMSMEKIYESFIDTGIDEIAYEVEKDDKKLKDRLIINLNSIVPDAKNNMRTVTEKINELADSSFRLYRENRPDYLSELLYYFAVFLGKNIFFETSTGDPVYINNVAKSLGYYGYTPIFIYPFINDVNILYKRSIERGLKEGRFLKCSNYGLVEQMTGCLKNYSVNVENISKFKNYLIFQYDANMNNDIFFEMNRFEFNNLPSLQLEVKYNIDDLNAEYHKKTENYNSKVIINTNCTN